MTNGETARLWDALHCAIGSILVTFNYEENFTGIPEELGSGMCKYTETISTTVSASKTATINRVALTAAMLREEVPVTDTGFGIFAGVYDADSGGLLPACRLDWRNQEWVVDVGTITRTTSYTYAWLEGHGGGGCDPLPEDFEVDDTQDATLAAQLHFETNLSGEVEAWFVVTLSWDVGDTYQITTPKVHIDISKFAVWGDLTNVNFGGTDDVDAGDYTYDATVVVST